MRLYLGIRLRFSRVFKGNGVNLLSKYDPLFRNDSEVCSVNKSENNMQTNIRGITNRVSICRLLSVHLPVKHETYSKKKTRIMD